MDCVKCGAPLPPKSNICRYCGALNDTDLRAIQRDAAAGPVTGRLCPRCETELASVNLKAAGSLYIEQCRGCMGIFFDPGELESLIDASISHVYEIDHARMETLIAEEGLESFTAVRYVKCPVCGELMNRTSYGPRSGVIVDVCKQDGVWLDGGELGQLLKWAKAGGRLHAQDRKEAQERGDERDRKRRRREAEAEQIGGAWNVRSRSGWDEADALTGLVGFLVGLMR